MINKHSNQGSALIATLWVVIVITGLVLLLAKSMRVEAMAGANRLAQAQAYATERGAEQFLLGAVEAEVATPGSTVNVGMEGRQIGDGYFWVMKPNPNDETARAYGLTDEAGKLDINSANDTALQLLPNMPADVASSIVLWRQAVATGSSSDGQGATNTTYEQMPDPYHIKQSPFECTEELMLVNNVTADLLYGSDHNRDGTVDSDEMKAANGGSRVAAALSSATSGLGTSTSNRGIFPFITAYGQRATATSATQSTTVAVVNVNSTNSSNRLMSVLNTYGVGSAASIATTTASYLRGNGRQTRQFSSIFNWANYVGIATADFSKIFTHVTCTVTGGTTRAAKINVNTAPSQVLMCLTGLQESDVQSIISHRQTATSSTSYNPADISWLMDTVSRTTLSSALVGPYLTGTSYIYSGDIVAVSPDGRAFNRVRVVIDGSKVPAYIIYRREVKSGGFPLPAAIQQAMRNGNPPPDANAAANASSSL